MAKKRGAATPDEHATSFLGMARQYRDAADLLYQSEKSLKSPTYFLYAHAIELALKAFLRAADLPIVADGKRKHHQITALYKECRELGLRIGPDDRDLRNLVALLEGANDEQGLRYFKRTSLFPPELSWTRDTVEHLLAAVEPSVKQKAQADGIVRGVAIKLDFTCSKPTVKY